MTHFAQINETQQKQLDDYVKKLNITTDGERFVLEMALMIFRFHILGLMVGLPMI